GSETKTVFESSDIRLMAGSEINQHPLARFAGSIMQVLSSGDDVFAMSKCSGFRLGRGYIITASHCLGGKLVFDQHQIARDDSLDRLEYIEIAGILRLSFDETLKIPEAALANEQAVLGYPVHVNFDLDYAIFEDPTPS